MLWFGFWLGVKYSWGTPTPHSPLDPRSRAPGPPQSTRPFVLRGGATHSRPGPETRRDQATPNCHLEDLLLCFFRISFRGHKLFCYSIKWKFFFRFGVRKKIARLRKNASFRPLAVPTTNRWRLNAHHQPFLHVRSWVPWIQLKRDRGSQVRGGNKFCLIWLGRDPPPSPARNCHRRY